MSRVCEILDAAVAELDAGRRAALCAIVAARGSTPQPAGTLLALDEAMRMTGTLGGGCVEAEIRRRAYQSLTRGRGELITVQLDHDYGYDDGMICGGAMDVAVDVLATPDRAGSLRDAANLVRAGGGASIPLGVDSAGGRVEYRIRVEAPPRLVIAGGGHIGRLLAELTIRLGFHVTVIDDRQEFANADRFPPPVEPVAAPIAETLRRRPLDSNTYVVIVTRGHRHDEQALAAVLGRGARYVGMIGSRRKIQVVFDDLLAAGARQEQLDAVHAPVGIDIGAVTTEEIALSISAQLVAVRRAGAVSVVEGPFPVPETSQ